MTDDQIAELIDRTCIPLRAVAAALEGLTEAVQQWVNLEQARYEKDFPERKVEPVTVGVAKYKTEETVPEDHGAIFPEEFGPRESGLREKAKRKAAQRQGASAAQ